MHGKNTWMRHYKNTAMTIHLNNFPQLRLIAWNMRDDDLVEEQEAFALYERNWRFVDQSLLLEHECALIERLRAEFGAGLMNV